MPSFKYRAITANCANDGLGVIASKKIARILKDEDFVVVNTQETHFANVQKELEKILIGSEYKIQCLASMVTHTKFHSQFNKDTGIGTFLISKKNISINKIDNIEVRRSSHRFSGSAYNKGGLITRFTLNNQQGHSLSVQTISGHLDSRNICHRSKDWATLHRSQAKSITNWQNLVDTCSTIQITGYDANTRNIIDSGEETNLSLTNPNHFEVQPFFRAPFGNYIYSALITYNKDKETIEDPQRPGYANKGMLDYLSIDNGELIDQMLKLLDSDLVLDTEASSARDHQILISPLMHYDLQTDFKSVKNYLYTSLHSSAPKLSRLIRELEQSDKNKLILLKVFKHYLGPNGVLITALDQHTNKLRTLKKMFGKGIIFNKDTVYKELSSSFFGNPFWCDGPLAKILAKQALMNCFLELLSDCTASADIKYLLKFYHIIFNNLNTSRIPLKNFEKYFFLLELTDFQVSRSRLANNLKLLPLDNPLRLRGCEVLQQLDYFGSEFIYKTLNISERCKLGKIAKYCAEACLDTLSVQERWVLLQKFELLNSKKPNTSGWKTLYQFLCDLVELIRKALYFSTTLKRSKLQTPLNHFKDTFFSQISFCDRELISFKTRQCP